MEQSASGTYVEGVGDEIITAVCTVFLAGAIGLFMFVKFIANSRVFEIHPESQENVNAARNRLGINPDVVADGNEQSHTSNTSRSQNFQRYYTDQKCPVCLLDARFPVETNCGHLFCGQCIIIYWRYGNWLGAVQCPVCRQQVTLLMRDFHPQNDNEDSIEIANSINDYNRRFSGQPRPILDYIRDLPAILRHVLRELFSVDGFLIMFRIRVFVCLILVFLYFISPFDVFPEAVLGFVGLFDDVLILLLVLVYVTIIYRQFIAERIG
ncbi:unnamed protein product [Clavelina lepadiformis]|uniref:E3 ubiquitin-protein ligase RNF170 n=1 Tax=Clavelina lepadiformis TaxID=159417 RepID=A0ABP0G146_CLALP